MAANITSLPNSAELLRARYTPSAPSHYGYQHLTSGVGLLSLDQQDKPASCSRPRAGNLRKQFTQRIQHPNSRYQIKSAAVVAPPASAGAAQLPAHKVLAARLSAAAARQLRKQQQQLIDNAWSVDLARDIAAICHELELPQAAASALTTAALKRQVSANPGVLLCQLVRLLPLDDALGGHRSVGKLLSHMPTLVRHDPATLLQNLAAVQGVLGRSCSGAVIMKQPQLLTCSPFRLQTNFAKLQELLAFSPAAAAAAAADQPVLLLASPRSLQQRLDVLRNSLLSAVPEDLLLKHLRRSPELLLLRPSTVAGKMQCLAAVFKHSNADAAAESGTQAAPSAAAGQQQQQRKVQHFSQQQQQQQQQQHGRLEGSQQLAAALARLKAASVLRSVRVSDGHQQRGSYRHWLPQQQQQQEQQVPSSSSSSGDARVQQLVLKVPGLLCLTPATLQLHVTELQLLLGLQPDDPALQRIIQLQPGLLTQAPATLANKLQLLQYLTGRDEPAVQEMVLKCPAILTLSVASVSRKWELLSSCVACCREWQQQLQQASHVTVAMALCYNEKRLYRLHHVAQLYMERGDLMGRRRRSSSSSSAAGQIMTAIGTAAASNVHSSSYNKVCSGSTIKRSHKACSAAPVMDKSERSEQQPKQRKQQRKQGLAAVPWRAIIQESDAAFQDRYAGLEAKWGEQQQQPLTM